MKIMNRCAKAQCAAAGGKKIDGLDHANVDPAGGEHFGLVLIACAELAAAVALLIKDQHKKKGTPIQTARGRGARNLLLQELDRHSDQVFIRDTRLDKKTVYKWWNIKK